MRDYKKIDTKPYDYMYGDCWLLAMALYQVFDQDADIYGLFDEEDRPLHCFIYNENTELAIDWRGVVPIDKIDCYGIPDYVVKELPGHYLDSIIWMYGEDEFQLAEQHARAKGII